MCVCVIYVCFVLLDSIDELMLSRLSVVLKCFLVGVLNMMCGLVVIVS